jgi:acetyl esterase
VELHRWPGQIHGFASMLGVIAAADQALSVAALGLRHAFAMEAALA